ncbi:MAG: TlpA family protein disulfide reductase [Gemmataceae bacterium]
MIPHERSLVKRTEGKPFVLLGVNSDESRKEVKILLKKEKITWRSFWNGGSIRGPISSEWGVGSWPTLVIIDAKGVIRHRFNGAPEGAVLDKLIEELLKETEDSR